MNRPDWVQKHWYDLRLAHQQPKAGARSRQTVVSVFMFGDGTADPRGERRTVVGSKNATHRLDLRDSRHKFSHGPSLELTKGKKRWVNARTHKHLRTN